MTTYNVNPILKQDTVTGRLNVMGWNMTISEYQANYTTSCRDRSLQCYRWQCWTGHSNATTDFHVLALLRILQLFWQSAK